MPYKKMAACALLFVLIIAAGFWLNAEIRKERYHYSMRPPVSNGTYRIYSPDSPDGSDRLYMPYFPREYVRIVDTER